jgi:hypothetical protein
VLPARGTGWAAAVGAPRRCVRATHAGWAAGWVRWRGAWAERGWRALSGPGSRAVAWGSAGAEMGRDAGSWRGPNGGEREGGGGDWAGRNGPGKGGWATFPLFLFQKLFFSFYLLHLIQIQMCHNFKLTPSSIGIKQKWSLGFNMMQHFILPWSLAY